MKMPFTTPRLVDTEAGVPAKRDCPTDDGICYEPRKLELNRKVKLRQCMYKDMGYR